MKSRKFTLTALASTIVIGGLLLAGCSTTVSTPSVESESSTTSSIELTTGVVAAEVLAANANATTVNDDEWSLDGAVAVTLTGSSASAAGEGVSVTGNTVTITAGGTYVLSGELDGQVVVDTADEDVVALVLDGANISNSSSAAIAVLNAEDVVVSLSGSNSVSSTGADEEANAALFSDADFTISGDGSLTVTSTQNDSLTIKDGTVSVDAGGDAVKSDEDEDETSGYVHIAGGTIDLVAGDDGVQAQTDIVMTGGETTLSATDDGLKAEVHIVVAEGTTTVSNSYEGIEAYYITVEGGTLNVAASDDGINATTGTSTTTDVGGIEEADDGAMIAVTGGEITVNSEGDGMDSNGSIMITGGISTVFGSPEDREGALDANGSVVVNGGTVLAVGMTGMATSPDADSVQGWLSAALDQSYGVGESVQLLDESGAVIAEFTSVKTFQSVVLSSADVTEGSTYTVTVGGQTTGTATAGVEAVGSMSGPGGMGGGAPRP